MPLQVTLKPNGVPHRERTTTYSGKPVIETLTNGYFTVDHKWTVKYWNKAAEKILGVVEKDIVGKNFWEQFSKSIPVEFYAVYSKAFLQDIPIHFQEYWGEMGAWFDVTTWYTDEVLCISFKSSTHPYPENPEHSRDRLNTLTELYRFVTEITNDCLWEWNLRTNEIFWIDGGHKRAFGYPIENTLVPVSFWKNCIHPDDRVRVFSKLDRMISEGKECIWEDEYRFKKADGTYCHVHDRGHIVYDDNNIPARIIGATQDISKRILLEKELVCQRIKQQREMTGAVLTALENERASIGEEIHDNLGQVLVAAKIYMEMARKTDENRDLNIDKSLEYITEVIDVVRRLSKSLIIHPPHIIGILDNIKNLVTDITAVHPIKIEFLPTCIIENELSDQLQLNIFRIVQEQITNILKHSEASHTKIFLSKKKDEVILLIADNGKGHDMTRENKGVGIINIKSRVELCNGHVSIHSEAGKGYELRANFPLSYP